MKKKTKQKMRLIVVAALCVVVFSGIQTVSAQPSGSSPSINQDLIDAQEPSPTPAVVQLERIEDDSPYHYVYRDVVTDVLYLESADGGITAMLDPETGLPLTYQRYQEICAAGAES